MMELNSVCDGDQHLLTDQIEMKACTTNNNDDNYGNNADISQLSLTMPPLFPTAPVIIQSNGPKDSSNQADIIINNKIMDNKSSPPSSKPNDLIDRYNFVYIVLILHGIAILMPWNMFINATEYFTEHKLTVNLDNGTMVESQYKEFFLSNLGIASHIPNVLFNVLNIFFHFNGGNIDAADGYTIRILGAILIEFFFIFLTVLLAWIDTSQWVTTFFYLTMATVIILNTVNGIYQNSLYGLASRLPMKYTNAIVTGTNICGTFTALINIVSIALSPNKRIAAIYFFTSAILVLVVAFGSFLILKSNKYYLFYIKNEKPLSQGVFSNSDKTTTLTTIGDEETSSNSKKENQHLLQNSVWMIDTFKSSDLKVAKSENGKPKRPPYLYVFRYVWKQCLNVFLVFFVTLSTFPVIQSGIKPMNPEYFGSIQVTQKYFVAVSCFLVFNSFAMFGNLVPNFITFPESDRLWIPIVGRFLFIPFFMLCNYVPDRRTWPVFIQSDSLYIFGGILMGLSSGYYSSLCMMYAPRSVPDPQHAGTAGMMAAASLVIGIFSGINFSYFLAWLVRQ